MLDVKWPCLTVLCPLRVVFQMTANTLKAFPPVGFSRLEEEEQGEREREMKLAKYILGYTHNYSLYSNYMYLLHIFNHTSLR